MKKPRSRERHRLHRRTFKLAKECAVRLSGPRHGHAAPEAFSDAIGACCECRQGCIRFTSGLASRRRHGPYHRAVALNGPDTIE